jgi:uncharacterized protein YgfB (UPF0149 family)
MEQGRFDLRDFEQLLDASDCPLSAAEAHGVLAGLSCAAPAGEDAAGAVTGIINAFGINADTQERLLDALLDAQRAVREQLEGLGFGFEPALPDEGEPLPARVEALADWCRGFVLGLLEGGVADATRLPGDAGEAARDLVELGSMGVEPGPYDDSHERAIAEVAEYVRVAVQLIYEELHADGAPADAVHH